MKFHSFRLLGLLAIAGFAANAATVQFTYYGTGTQGSIGADGSGNFSFADNLVTAGAFNTIRLSDLSSFSFQITGPIAGSTYTFDLSRLQTFNWYVYAYTGGAFVGPILTASGGQGNVPNSGTASLNFSGGAPFNEVRYSNYPNAFSLGLLATTSYFNPSEVPEPSSFSLLGIAGSIGLLVARKKNRVGRKSK